MRTYGCVVAVEELSLVGVVGFDHAQGLSQCFLCTYLYVFSVCSVYSMCVVCVV